jgi:butyryl-CoA dehydrogenase
MDFMLTDEQKMLRDAVRDFARSELEKKAWEIDRSREFPKDNFFKAAEMNLAGVTIPEEYGGAGMDTLSYVLAIEEISRVCATTGVILSVNNSLVCEGIYQYGSEEQRKKFLVPLAKGEQLGCYCLSEPDAGTDAANQKTTAMPSGNHYVMNGAKNFITNAPGADVAIVFARTGRTGTHKDISAFLVETATPGFKVSKVEHKLGITASGSSEIAIMDCKVPKANLMGREGEGFKIAMSILDGGRVGIAAQALGITQRALDESIKFAKERRTFGKPIAEYQAIQFKIADMATQLEAARMLTYKAACMKDEAKKSGGRFSKWSAMAKLMASAVCVRAANEAVQIHGGYGYMQDYVVERLYRDSKITEIYEGTSEVQRMVVAASVLKEHE